jgi:murein DD-endopeptidase MepM/ murein hydrolase activator NlpD
VFVAALAAACVSVAAITSVPARAQDTEPTTTTEPDTTTTVPETTTTTVPDTTTTTTPDTTTTTTPDTTSTTSPDTTSTTLPAASEQPPGSLDPSEPLVARDEFGALSGHQRALVQDLQDATDTYAWRRFALLDLTRQVAVAKDVVARTRVVESVAMMREVLGVTEAAHFHPDVAAFRALANRLGADRKSAHRGGVEARAELADLSARLTAQTQAVADALTARSAAESAIEDELGSDAVRARPDAITATLVTAQAGQADPEVIDGIGQPIPGAPLGSPFGLRNDPLGGGAGFHPGVDLDATSGTPIHAAGAGIVVVAGDCGGYGNCVVIDHGSSLATLYGHQSGVLVQVGEHVDAGQTIGLVGSTGMSTGPHLHFEVRLHGLPIDPMLALTD